MRQRLSSPPGTGEVRGSGRSAKIEA
jgi:hypothetical protein